MREIAESLNCNKTLKILMATQKVNKTRMHGGFMIIKKYKLKKVLKTVCKRSNLFLSILLAIQYRHNPPLLKHIVRDRDSS